MSERAARLCVIGFDADDTLWENEQLFRLMGARFAGLPGDFAKAGHLSEKRLAARWRKLAHDGSGIDGFTLSMIEAAIEVTGGRAPPLNPVQQSCADGA